MNYLLIAAFLKIGNFLILQIGFTLILGGGRRRTRGEECSREICPTKYNNEIDLQFLDIDKYNNYKRVLNVTALVLRFFSSLKKNEKKK